MNKKELYEFNVKARELKRAGNFDELRTLASEKGVSTEQVDNFILGKILTMDDTKEVVNTEVEEPKVEVIIPFYKSIEEKLEQEQEMLLKSVKEEKEKVFIKAQLKSLIDFILNDEELKVKAFQNWKELERCYKYLSKNAKKHAVAGCACIADATVFGWVKEYYDLDDQKEVEEERIKKAQQEAKMAEVKKKATESKPKKPRKTKAQKEAEKAAEESKDDKTEDDIPEVDAEQSEVTEETVNTSSN
jgi:hypothetical protein